MPKVSIITPIYCDTSQKVDWLDEMIQSVQSQTLADWEIILINDKSPLPLDMARMKHAGDARLRWFENAENDGPAKTRNTAVALAESECILPLDADDMLADNEVLEYMYDAWIMDQTKTIYGNVQLYLPIPNAGFQRGKVVQLAEYSFENAMNLGGTMPVTVMHSKEAHYQAGGWKAELDSGREDVEYWIAASERGFCGLKINTTTLLYRKHEQSRDYKLKFENKNLRAMQEKIKAMHSDIYKGVFPVACCGKGSSQQSVPDPVMLSQQNQAKANRITALDGYDEKDLEWVSYQGPKKGRFDILARGSVGPSSYTVLGTGHYFQIHKSHHKIFSDRQHLKFRVNQPDPRQGKEQDQKLPEPTVKAVAQVIEMPAPEMSTIVRMDSIASQTREADIQEIARKNFEPIAKTANKAFEQVAKEIIRNPILDDLGLSKGLTVLLSAYRVNELAKMKADNLIHIPGIGIKRANNIIAKAQELIKNT